MSEPQRSAPCRLCGGDADHEFAHRILGRHDAGYFRCRGCGSLFCGAPTWLDEAYAFPGTTVDVGSALRPLLNWLLLVDLFDRAGFERAAPYIDFGANTGLLTRYMRYSGYNFTSYEKYVTPYYSDYNRIGSLVGARCFGVTAFEVLEHFAEPAAELAALFATRPAFVIASTQLYDGQGPDWDYLAPYCGQHVFFYSERALAGVAERAGYRLAVGSAFQLFVQGERADEPAFRALRDGLLSPSLDEARAARVLGGVLHGNPHIEADHREAIARFTAELGAPPGPSSVDPGGDAQRVAQLTADLAALARAREADDRELARLRLELERVSSSTSWRLTAPLRRLYRRWSGTPASPPR